MEATLKIEEKFEQVNWDAMSTNPGLYTCSKTATNLFLCIASGLVVLIYNGANGIPNLAKATKEVYGEYKFLRTANKTVTLIFET